MGLLPPLQTRKILEYRLEPEPMSLSHTTANAEVLGQALVLPGGDSLWLISRLGLADILVVQL